LELQTTKNDIIKINEERQQAALSGSHHQASGFGRGFLTFQAFVRFGFGLDDDLDLEPFCLI
jgi:hypothetical protein